MKIILASASPRRSELMRMLGLDFEVKPSDAEEIMPKGISPAETVMDLAMQKAYGVTGDVVISADTIVCINGEILGKPKTTQDAFTMLRKLSGKVHEVYTGICVNGVCEYEMTKVHFDELSDEEIEAYIKSGEPMDKAGAYGAQGLGAVFVKKIEGDFFNVMGFPVHRLYNMLKSVGVDII